jgi:hypothetical protein
MTIASCCNSSTLDALKPHPGSIDHVPLYGEVYTPLAKLLHVSERIMKRCRFEGWMSSVFDWILDCGATHQQYMLQDNAKRQAADPGCTLVLSVGVQIMSCSFMTRSTSDWCPVKYPLVLEDM